MRTALHHIWLLCMLLCLAPSAGLAAAAPERIVALVPSLAELTCNLDACSLLVGRVQHSNRPAQVQKLPVVGSYFRPDLERLISLRPDLCLAMSDGTPKNAIERLRSMGIPVLVLSSHTFSDLSEALMQLGEKLNRRGNAVRLIQSMNARIAAVEQKQQERSQAEHPVTLFQVQAFPPMFAGPDSFAGELIRRAGGRNPLPEGERYFRMNQEQLLALRPEVVIIPDMARAQEAVAAWMRFPSVPAVRNGRIHIVEADAFCQPTLRSLDALEQLHGLLYPDSAAAR